VDDLIELLITGAAIVLVLLVVIPLIRRQMRRNDGKAPRYIWILISIGVVVVVVLTIYNLSRPR
jgi:multisubunit Na+/H+ antiporter MnhB subunit